MLVSSSRLCQAHEEPFQSNPLLPRILDCIFPPHNVQDGHEAHNLATKRFNTRRKLTLLLVMPVVNTAVETTDHHLLEHDSNDLDELNAESRSLVRKCPYTLSCWKVRG
jgi:hypothetical protein